MHKASITTSTPNKTLTDNKSDHTMRRTNSIGSKRRNTSTTTSSSKGTTYATALDGHLQTRIHTPHPHDVLSGRGGSINSHTGNVQFREWVRVRKNAYNLAVNKVEKTHVAQQVITLVRQQDPPGRFLHKDPASSGMGWWIELDEEKILAKTAQALREGAPLIRQMYKTEDDRPSKKQRTRKESDADEDHHETYHQYDFEPASPHKAHSKQEAALKQLRAHVLEAEAAAAAAASAERQHQQDQYGDIGADEETPPLMPMSPDRMLAPPPLSLPLPMKKTNNNLPRSHSLALSDFSSNGGDWMEEDFVNPFEDESVINGSDILEAATSRNGNGNGSSVGWPLHTQSSSSLSRLTRPQSLLAPMIKHESTSSSEGLETGDLGGINVLLRNNNQNSNHTHQSEDEDGHTNSNQIISPTTDGPTVLRPSILGGSDETAATNSTSLLPKGTASKNGNNSGVRRTMMSDNDENSRPSSTLAPFHHEPFKQQQPSNSRLSILSSSDWPLLLPETEFNVGVKSIYEALREQEEQDDLPPFVPYPFYPRALRRSTSSSSNNKQQQRGMDGRQ